MCKLIKGLYCLKQVPIKCCNKAFKDFLAACGLKERSADSSLYVSDFNGKNLIVPFYADDGLGATNCENEITELLTELGTKFKAKVTNNVKSY